MPYMSGLRDDSVANQILGHLIQSMDFWVAKPEFPYLDLIAV